MDEGTGTMPADPEQSDQQPDGHLSRRTILGLGALGATTAAIGTGVLGATSAAAAPDPATGPKAAANAAPAVAGPPVGDGVNGSGLQATGGFGYAGANAGGDKYDRLRMLTAKLPRNGNIASGGGPGSSSMTLTAAPTGLQPNQPILLAGGTAEVVYTASGYAAGSNPVTLATPIANSGHTAVVYDVFSANGPRATDMTAFGILPVACVISEGASGLYTMMLAAGHDQGPPINTVMVSPSLVSGPAAQMDRQRSLGAAGDGLGVALAIQPSSTPLSAVAAGANQAAAVALNAVVGQRHRLTMLIASYSAAPSGGGITVQDGPTTVLAMDIASPGATAIPLPPGGIAGTAGLQLTATLAAGGPGVVGKLSIAKLTT
jgi:hypothetical protein